MSRNAPWAPKGAKARRMRKVSIGAAPGEPMDITSEGKFPSSADGSFPTRILLVSDSSPASWLATQAATDVANKTGSELYTLRAARTARPRALSSRRVPDVTVAHRQRNPEMLAAQSDEDDPGNIVDLGIFRSDRRSAKRIASLSLQIGAGLLVVGKDQHRLLSSNIAQRLTRLSPCPLLIVRPSKKATQEAWPPKELVVGMDLSPESKRVAAFCAALASALSVKLSIVFAYYRFPETMEPQGLTAFDSDEDTKWHAWRWLEWISRSLEATVGYRPSFRILPGEESSAIVRTAKEAEQPSLIAVGSRRLGRTRRALLGSVSSSVLRSAHCPILIVPPLSPGDMEHERKLSDRIADAE